MLADISSYCLTTNDVFKTIVGLLTSWKIVIT